MSQKHSPVKVAVIGDGGWGYHHARIAASHLDIYFCAVVGRTADRTAARAAHFGVPSYLDRVRGVLTVGDTGNNRTTFVSPLQRLLLNVG